MSEELEFEPNLLNLMDEEGVEHEFEVIDTLEFGNERYMALVPADEADDDEDGELVILKVVVDGDEEYLEPIESEEEFNKIAAMFMERLEDDFDFKE